MFIQQTVFYFSYLWLIHPSGIGTFTICRADDIRRIQRYAMLTVVHAGKAVLVFKALANGLVSRCIHTLWWRSLIEEIAAFGEVLVQLSEDQTVETDKE